MKTQNRYLLKVRLFNNLEYTQTFKKYQDMADYILARDFFFITADYSTYDLAIQLRKAG